MGRAAVVDTVVRCCPIFHGVRQIQIGARCLLRVPCLHLPDGCRTDKGDSGMTDNKIALVISAHAADFV
jgi:hypothetical protein